MFNILKTYFSKSKFRLVPILLGLYCLTNESISSAEDGTSAPILPRPALSSNISDDLRVQELTSTFINFQVAREGESGAHFALYGVVFDDCVKFFKITNSTTDPQTLAQSKDEDGVKVLGFRISDVNGLGRACMAQHQANHDICGKTEKNTCTQLDKLAGASIAYSGKSDVRFKFGYEPENHNSRTPIVWSNFEDHQFARSSADTFFRGRDSYAREEARARASEKQSTLESKKALLEDYKKQAYGCRKNHDQRVTALSAIETLGELGALEVAELEKLRKEVLKAELRDLASKLNKAKLDEDSSDLDDAVSDLRQFAQDHPESGDAVANAFHNKAASMVKSSRKPESYDKANELIDEAIDISDLSEKTERLLKADKTGIRAGRLQALAKSNQADPYELNENYSVAMQELGSQVQDCASNGIDASCASTIQAFQAVAKVPQMAQQAAYERYMFQMQLQQQMYGALGGQTGGAVNPYGMGYPMAGGMMGGMAMGSPFFQ